MQASFSRQTFGRLGAAILGFVAVARPLNAGAASGKTHRVALQVDNDDPAVMNLALNNAANVATYYSGVADEYQVEIVAYGPGLHMLINDSPVKDRIASIKASIPEVVFSACNVTKTAMEKAAGHPIVLVPQARIVPSGAIRLIQLQEMGWSYLKP